MNELKPIKLLHQVWIQGHSELPLEYARNREAWKSSLPDDWQMILWDDSMARDHWPDYREVADECSHHAMRADLILARAQRDFGGIATGTDVIPNNIPNLMKWIECNDTMVIANIRGKSSSNGLSYFGVTHHPFVSCLCKHQLRDRSLLANTNVWGVTGPGCWYQALASQMWNVCMVPDVRAYTKLYSDTEVRNPDAWVDAGYAGSWHVKEKE